MTGRSGHALEVLAGLLALAAATLACFVCGVVWIADFSGSNERSGPAGASAAILALGIVVALVWARARRSWGLLALVLLGAGVVAALPWVPLL